MARYIDADAAVEEARLAYCKECNSYNGVMCRACAFDDAMSFIEDFPESDVAPKSEVAREIIDELLEALQGEVDAEEKLDSSAWDESDMIGHYMHQYAVEKLETLVIALSLYKKKYTEDQT